MKTLTRKQIWRATVRHNDIPGITASDTLVAAPQCWSVKKVSQALRTRLIQEEGELVGLTQEGFAHNLSKADLPEAKAEWPFALQALTFSVGCVLAAICIRIAVFFVVGH